MPGIFAAPATSVSSNASMANRSDSSVKRERGSAHCTPACRTPCSGYLHGMIAVPWPGNLRELGSVIERAMRPSIPVTRAADTSSTWGERYSRISLAR
jgi:hypothetical protein